VAAVYILVLGLAGWLMATRRLAATITLPLTAICIGLIAVSTDPALSGWTGRSAAFLGEVLDGGLSRLSSAIIAVILGAVLAAQLKLSGAAERVVRYAAEYSGEDRFRLGLILLTVIALLFTTLGGLGAVILVASIALPLMFSLGFEPKVAASVLLFGLSMGGCLNPVNWAAYTAMLDLTTGQIVPFAAVMATTFYFVAALYLLTSLRSGAALLAGASYVLEILLAALAIGALAWRSPGIWLGIKQFAALAFGSLVGMMLLLLLLRMALGLTGSRPSFARGDNWVAAAAPLLPLFLLLWAGLDAALHPDTAITIPLNAALLLGIVYFALASAVRGSTASTFMRCLHEALPAAGPAVMLLLGIGMLLKATALPEVAKAMAPLIAALPVGTPAGFVAVFFILSPLALFRGPLNLYGMGSGIAGIIAGTGALAGPLVMVALFSVGMLQGVCDPTNTHNVWVANFCRVSTGEILRHTLPWILATVLLGLAAGAMLFLPEFAAAMQL
jgi:hypothetical protein